MKNPLCLFAALSCLAGAAFAAPARLYPETGCHVDNVYQSDAGFAVHFSDCEKIVSNNSYSTVFWLTNFSDGVSKAYLATFLTAQSTGAKVTITYDDAVTGNLYGLGIMKHSAHQWSLALKLLDVQMTN